MQTQGYQDFLKLGKQKQYEMVMQKKQQAASPIAQIAKFPEVDFMPLVSTQDKKKIKLTTYRYPSQNAKGVVIIFHNLGYHIPILGNFAKAIANGGYTVVGYDQRGHGKSEGQRGYLDDQQLIMKDAKTFIENIFKQYPNIPIFLAGQGVGSLLSIIISQEFKNLKFAGMILISPSFKKPAQSKVLSAVSDFALKLMPNKAGIFHLVFENVVRNPTASEYLKNEPDIYHGKVFVGSLMQMMTMMQKNEQKNWKKLQTCPLVIVQGGYDKVSDPINSINFYQSIKTKDKQLWWYPNMWNSFFFEPEFDDINSRIVKWLSVHS